MKEKIENLIKELEKKKSSALKLYVEYSELANIGKYHEGRYKELDFSIGELKKILNEAVVCGSERNQTMCKRVAISSPETTEVAEYCLKCKKEFDFFGKEITS